MPVYNEERTILLAIKEVLGTDFNDLKLELIVINDGSNDGTGKLLEKVSDKRVKIMRHDKNQGKGAAVRTGLTKVTGEIVLVHDADLEYDPGEFMGVIKPIIDGKADVVYGSRFIGNNPHRVLYFWHYLGNKLLTLISDALTNLNLTDVNVCTKAFLRTTIEKVTLEENGFGFDPEVTAKLAKQKCRIYEVGVSYFGRSYQEGKKIRWTDGFRHLFCMFKYNLE